MSDSGTGRSDISGHFNGWSARSRIVAEFILIGGSAFNEAFSAPSRRESDRRAKERIPGPDDRKSLLPLRARCDQ